jgi:hypothetical protein
MYSENSAEDNYTQYAKYMDMNGKESGTCSYRCASDDYKAERCKQLLETSLKFSFVDGERV